MPSMSFAEYRKNDAEARFTDWLRSGAEPHWTRMTTHRFARELGEDTLDDAVAGRYLVQDYAFVNSFVSLLGSAIAAAPAMPSKRRFAGFAAAVTADENDFFLRSFEALGIPEGTWKTPELGPVTRDFIAVLEGAGRSGSYPHILAVLVAAEWSYLTWAQACPARRPERFWLTEWIDLHAIPEFEAFVTWLREETDRVGMAADEGTGAAMRDSFRRMMVLEEAFFDAAYGGQGPATSRVASASAKSPDE
ncbi:TenA family protein [Skermanella mucosa]|uniref:TenA family protein n=1 Tax=Skermanella mucosa TaxID=1789672 RepID=UPI001E42B462|nr:TenA family protein [Skermanella mucosa]UEM21480.1 TenA family protein [Skermanella mucosa]